LVFLRRSRLRFVQDLGLCRLEPAGGLVIANPIYREVIPRVLTYVTNASMPAFTPFWVTPDGEMDPTGLLNGFLAFWRQNGEMLMKTVPYHEAAPHLILMAFLHRVVNAAGTIERDYAVGKGAVDLCVRYRDVTLAIAVKTWRDSDKKADPREDGLKQLDRYLSALGLDWGWLVIFDQRSGLPDIAERTTTEPATTPAGRTATVIRA
jgi:hypothetical protein